MLVFLEPPLQRAWQYAANPLKLNILKCQMFCGSRTALFCPKQRKSEAAVAAKSEVGLLFP